MTLLLDPPVRRAPTSDVLAELREEACNLAIWERAAPAGLERLLDVPLAPIRFAAPLAALDPLLADALDAAGYAPGPARAALARDVAALARRYGAIMDCDQVQLRLEVVTTDSCRKFHADYVSARLITTYLGKATQWLDAEDAARLAQGQAPRRIRALEPGHVGLFKGWQATHSPAIHRSPPIEQAGEARLLLVINPPQCP